jgi:M6 family metalloprotease-like protein
LNKYIRNLAYLERITQTTIDTLKQSDLFRWSGLYQPAFKIDPNIGKRNFVTNERKAASGVFLIVVLFPEAEIAETRLKIEFLGLSVLRQFDDSKRGGRKRLRVRATNTSQIEKVAALEEVEWIEEQGDITIDNGTSTAVVQSDTATQTPIYNHGLRGEGQIVGLIDATLDMNHCFFNDAVNPIGPAHRKVVGYRQDNAQTFTTAQGCIAGHGTHTGGTIAGQSTTVGNNGIAMNARLTYGDLNDLNFAGGTRTFLEYLNAAHTDGAFIHSNSWSDKSTTAYTVDSQDLDTFTWNNEDDLVVVSSSNNIDTNSDGVSDSPSPVHPPWTSKNGLAVAASAQAPNQINVNNGGLGPTGDGRRKPEIYAPGAGINSSQAGTNCGTQQCTGSSMATPAIAAAAALTRQYYTQGFYPTGTRQPHNAFTPSGALLKATMLNSTRDMTGNDAFGAAAPLNGYPSNLEGWGRLTLDDSLFFPGDARNLRVWDFRNSDGLLTGDSRQHVVNVSTNGQPLRITLVWMEPPPAAANFANPVINDLNLVVTSPDGTQTFIGNDFNAGLSAPNTGNAADALNNVEMVVINAPAPGRWTITVNGAAVNVGNPSQGYALVATADMPEPPATTGNQDTLVVRVKFNDVAFEPPLANLQNTMNDAVTYFNEVTYNQASILPEYRGPINLDHPKDYYYHPSRSLLIELTEDVVSKLVTAEPDIFTKGTPDPADDIDRLVLVTNDVNFTGDWATTGPWPYDMPGGFTRPISVSIQSYSNPVARFNHGLGHQLNLVDLYAHPGVVFPRAYVDEWDNMAGLFTNVHFLTWEKQRAEWITSQGSSIEYIPRPAAGASYTGLNPIPLFSQESTAANRKAIAIGLTNGATTLANEDVFYYVEARDNTSGFDSSLPGSGVLIYFVNERIPQGQGPVILLDKNPGTPTLGDAAFTVGDSRMIPGTGITITVEAGTGGAAFNIRVAYTPLNNDYNAFITAGDTIDGEFIPYFSSDIWVDSPRNGFNLGSGPPPSDQIENPVVGMVNRIYARIHNNGPGTAFDFDVRFRISEPYHTVGGEADFDHFVGIQHITSLGQDGTSGSPTIVFVEWTPTDDGDPHSCVLVDLINLVGTDTNQFDNIAQENMNEVASITASPFHPVTYRYDLTNPYTEPALFYFRAAGAPNDWSVVLNPKKILLNPGERVEGSATITPPPNGQVCTAEQITITSWAPRGDTIIPVGGGIVRVDLRKQTLLTLDTGIERCEGNDIQLLHAHASNAALQRAAVNQSRSCFRITAQGCTDPKLANQEIFVKFIDPDGNPVYHKVMTDANGCYEDFLVTDKGGPWKVDAEYDGDKCQGPATSKPGSVFVPPGTQGPGGFGRGKPWFSFHLGMNFPLGSFNQTHDPGPSMTLNAEYPFRDNLSVVGFLGFHYFHGETGIPDFHYTDLTVNLRQYFPVSTFRAYVEGGPGIYFPKTGPNKFGFNVGTGFSFNLQPNLKFEVGPEFHFVDPSGVKRVFVDARMGLAFRF